MADEQKRALGQRLKRTAKAAGFTSEQIGERLGYTGGGVRGWWMGKAEPPMETLRRYAGLVGRSVDYLVSGAEAEREPSDLLFGIISQWADLVANKVPGTEAMRRVQNETLATKEDRSNLDEVAPQMLKMLSDYAGKDWAEASEVDRRRAVGMLIAEVESWRLVQKPPPDS